MKKPILFLGMLLMSMVSQVDMKSPHNQKQKDNQIQKLLKSESKNNLHKKSNNDHNRKAHNKKQSKRQKDEDDDQKERNKKQEKKNKYKRDDDDEDEDEKQQKNKDKKSIEKKRKNKRDEDDDEDEDDNKIRRNKKHQSKDKKHKHKKQKNQTDSDDQSQQKLVKNKQTKHKKGKQQDDDDNQKGHRSKKQKRRQKNNKDDQDQDQDQKNRRQNKSNKKIKKSSNKRDDDQDNDQDQKQQNKNKRQNRHLKKKQNQKSNKQINRKHKSNQKSNKKDKHKSIQKKNHKKHHDQDDQEPIVLNPSDFKQLTKKLTIIDTRPAAQDGLIKGSYWFADQDIIKKWIGVVLKKDTEYLLVTEKGKQKETVKMLTHLGYKKIRGVNGFDIKNFEGHKNVPAIKHKNEIQPQKCFNLNVKSKKECNGIVETKKKTPNSLIIPLEQLEERVDELKDKENIVINCKDQNEAKVAYSILAKNDIYCYVLSQANQPFNQFGTTIIKY